MRKKNEAGGLAGVQEFLVVSSSGGVVAGTLLNRNPDWSFFSDFEKKLDTLRAIDDRLFRICMIRFLK